jgi:hypothetical protein
MSAFNARQTEQLLKPIAGQRVLRDAKGHSHVSQQDVTAHLIRMFGFGGFDTEVLDVQCIFEDPHVDKKSGEVVPGRFDVCYRALLRLAVKDETGRVVAQYEDGSTATAQNQTRGDAHDLAYKSAISLAKKRAAINLGDQFGLSLYNKGQTSALVIKTLVGADDDPPADVQEDVPQQVAMGNDETDYDVEPDPVDLEPWQRKIDASSSLDQLAEVGQEIASASLPGSDRKTLRAAYTSRVKELSGDAA